MSEFTPIETQEDFDKAIKSRLAQKDREFAEKYKDYLAPDKLEAMKADFKKQLDDANAKLKEANDKVASHDLTVSELTQRAEKAESSLLKNQVAYRNHIPVELAGRLIGTTEEELEADAKTISGLIKPNSAPPLHTGTAGKEVNDMSAILASINAQMAN